MKIDFSNRGDFRHMSAHKKADLIWSDKFIPDAKQIIIDNWSYLLDSVSLRVSKDVRNKIFSVPCIDDIEVANFEDDTKKATDLYFMIRYSVDSTIRIGCRIQRDKGYRNISIRTYRISGVRTEYNKLKEDRLLTLYFLGWVSDEKLNDWIIYDPVKFVDLGFADLCKQREIWCEKPPKKLESKFGSISVKDAKSCILCSAKEVNQEQIVLF